LLLTISPTIEKDTFVNISCKKINPIYYGKGYEVTAIRMMKFVFGTHNLKIAALDYMAQVTRNSRHTFLRLAPVGEKKNHSSKSLTASHQKRK
jgi:hypothetical protein